MTSYDDACAGVMAVTHTDTPYRATVLVHGIPVEGRYNRTGPYAGCITWGSGYRDPRRAAWMILRQRPRPHGKYALVCHPLSRTWELHPLVAGAADHGCRLAVWPARPKRRQLADTIRSLRAGLPSRSAPSTLGWRAWNWDAVARVLRSPHRGTPWPTAACQASAWSDEDALRGRAGIHARRMPRDWRRAIWKPSDTQQEGPAPHPGLVCGIVERYGRAIVGPLGWRAEHVVIRGLVAPSIEMVLALMERYPDVEVVLATSRQEVSHANR